MRKKIHKVILGMLMLSMLVGGMTFNARSAAAADDAKKTSVFITACNSFPAPLSEIQYQKFMLYLTQEYAPELKTEWEKAFAERPKIQSDFQIQQGTVMSVDAITATDAVGEIGFAPVSAEDLEKMKVDLPEGARIQAWKIKSSDSDPQTVSIVVTDAAMAETDRDRNMDQKKDKINLTIKGTPPNEHFTTQLSLQSELDQALADKDSAAVNTVLEKMLANYRQITEDIKADLSKVVVSEK